MTIRMTAPPKLTARTGLYHLLSRVWLREIDTELLQDLLKAPTNQAAAESGLQLPVTCSADVLECLAVDYCRLFVGPTDHFPPCQSVWISRQLSGSAVGSMKQYLEIARFNQSSLPDGTMLDHLGVQLKVMSHLLMLQTSAQNCEETSPAITSVIRCFCRDHLSWPEELLIAAETRAQTDFYRSMIRLTRSFLSQERSLLIEEVAD